MGSPRTENAKPLAARLQRFSTTWYEKRHDQRHYNDRLLSLGRDLVFPPS